MCAASVEALVNYFGYAKDLDWNKHTPAPAKFRSLYAAVGLDFDEDADPFQSLERLRII